MLRAARFAILLAALGASGCAVSREGARDRAVAHACDRLQACGNIGSGQMYSTRDDCEIKQRSFWTDYWPAADCEDRISGDALDYCLQSIDRAACGISMDIFTTLSACKKGDVCSGR